jgi:UDP-N-acetylglucosamine 2-epimerase (non-hydrolysing)
MKIISVVGARPNFMKVAPLHRVFSADPQIESVIVHTGQHYDERMSQVFFDQLGLPQPHHFLGIGGGSHTQQTAQIMLAFEKVLDTEQPDLVIVVGDVNSTVACALTAVKKKVKVAHVEAGLRSGDRSMPEEINRVVTDAISDLLFVSEKDGQENLLAEGIAPEKIHFVGNVMIDSLVHFLPQADLLAVQDILKENLIDALSSEASAQDVTVSSEALAKDVTVSSEASAKEDFVLVTMHRPSNVDHREGLARILSIIRGMGDDVSVVFAVHPRTKKNLQHFALWQELITLPQVILTHPLSYLDFLKLMKEARLVITDSGGIQEETTYLKVPCITFRASTERPSTVKIGSNTLMAELDVEKVLTLAKELIAAKDQRNTYQIPELWDGHSAERILAVLKAGSFSNH